MLKIKRAYEKHSPSDGIRILVDRLWPRGVSHEEAHLDLWLKDVSPSDELREWFNHDPEKWQEFKKRYYSELRSHKHVIGHDPEQWEHFKKKYLKGFGEDSNIYDALKKLAEHYTVTFVYGAHEERYNNAAALKEYLHL